MALKISGPFNIQMLAKGNQVKVIECNLRASRTFPFVSKTFGCNFISLATQIMLGQTSCKPFEINLYDYDYVAVKAPMFSFTRLRGADPTLGVEMASTGEVACFGKDVHDAFLQALLASTFRLPQVMPKGNKYILVSIAEDCNRAELLESLQQLTALGYFLAGTPGTADYYRSKGIEMVSLTKPVGGEAVATVTTTTTTTMKDEKGEIAAATAAAGGGGGGGGSRGEGEGEVEAASHSSSRDEQSVLAWIRSRKIDLVINIPEGTYKRDEITAGYLMRREAVDFGCALLTNVKCCALFCEALSKRKPLSCFSSEEYIGRAHVGYQG